MKRAGLEQGGEAAAERVDPIGDREAEGLLDLRLVEDRVGRALHRAGELGRVARLDVAGGTRCPVGAGYDRSAAGHDGGAASLFLDDLIGHLSDHLREIVPAANPFITKMIDAAYSVIPDLIGDLMPGGQFRARALWSRGVQGLAGPIFLVRRTLDPRRDGLQNG